MGFSQRGPGVAIRIGACIRCQLVQRLLKSLQMQLSGHTRCNSGNVDQQPTTRSLPRSAVPTRRIEAEQPKASIALPIEQSPDGLAGDLQATQITHRGHRHAA